MKSNRPLVLAAVLALAAIGAATAGIAAHASSSATTVRVTEREFHIALSVRSVRAGAVTFVVRNTGKLSHALEIAGPGLKKKTRLIKPGASARLSATLKAGRYTLWCPVPGHAALGMKTTLTASGSSSSAGSGTSSGTTTSSGGGGGNWG